MIDQIENIFFEVRPILLREGAVRQYGVVQIDSEWSAPVTLTTEY
jgi:hypothetical protein